MNADGNLTLEETLSTAQGKRTFLTTKGRLHGAGGEVIGLFGIARDITERMAVQAESAVSERLYRLMFDASPIPMLVQRLEDFRFVAVNEASVRHYGYSREEFLSMTIMDIRPPEEVNACRSVSGSTAAHRC